MTQSTRVDAPACTSFPVLTTALVECRNCLPTNGDESLTRVIDTFLDQTSRSLSLSAAYRRAGGGLRLLQYLAARESPLVDSFLRRWEFNNVVGEAAARGDLDTLAWLVKSYIPDEFLCKAVAEAADNGQLHILKWLWEKHRSSGSWGGIELCYAMERRHRDVVRWLRAHVEIRPGIAKFLIRLAAIQGDVDFVRLLYEEFEVEIVVAFAAAVRKAQWGVVLWLLDNAKRADLDAALRHDDIFLFPARLGDLDMLKWLHEEKQISNAGDGHAQAAANGRLDVLKYLLEKGLGRTTDACVLDAAASWGDVKTVGWLHFNIRERCFYRAMDGAAGQGHLAMVKWLHDNRTEGCSLFAADFAAENGHLETVKWLHANRDASCHLLDSRRAAQRGNLEMVNWLYAHRDDSFELEEVLDTAAAQGHFDILQWFHEKCEGGWTTAAMNQASANDHLEVVQWLHEHRSEGCTQRAMDEAVRNRHFEVVKWLHLNRSEGCSPMAINAAAANGHLHVVKWLRLHRLERCAPFCMVQLLKRSARLDTVAFLFSEFPECRDFHLGGTVKILRREVVGWLLARAPRALEGRILEVDSWN